MWPDWRQFGFLTDLDGAAVAIDAFHRRHAVVELATATSWRGRARYVPSGNFSANGAWLCCAVLADNLIRWTATIGLGHSVRRDLTRLWALQPAPG